MYIKILFEIGDEKDLERHWGEERLSEYKQNIIKSFSKALKTTEDQFKSVCLRELLQPSLKIVFFLLVFRETTHLWIEVGVYKDKTGNELAPVFMLHKDPIIFPLNVLPQTGTVPKPIPTISFDAEYAIGRVVSDLCRDGLTKEMKNKLNLFKQTLPYISTETWTKEDQINP